MVEWLFLGMPWGCSRFVIVVFSDHTHLLFLGGITKIYHTVSRYVFGKNYFFTFSETLEVMSNNLTLK